jgi:hypothetical protein
MLHYLHYLRGRYFQSKHYWRRAGRAYQKAIGNQQTSRPPTWHYRLGFVSSKAGKWDTAEQHLKIAVDKRPHFLEWQYRLARVLDKRQAKNAADILYLELLKNTKGALGLSERHPVLPNRFLAAVLQAYKRQDWPTAIAGLRDLVAYFNKTGQAPAQLYVKLGNALYFSHQHADARMVFLEGLQHYPEEFGLHVGSLLLDVHGQDWDKIAALWANLHERYPESFDEIHYCQYLHVLEAQHNWAQYKFVLDVGLARYTAEAMELRLCFYRMVRNIDSEQYVWAWKRLRFLNTLICGSTLQWLPNLSPFIEICKKNLPETTLNEWGQPFVIASRADGFGARLLAVMNGLYLSTLLGIDFAYAWRQKIFSGGLGAFTDKLILGNFAEKNLWDGKPLLAHVSDTEEAIFSEAFINQYSVGGLSPSRGNGHLQALTTLPKDYLFDRANCDAEWGWDSPVLGSYALEFHADLGLPPASVAIALKDIFWKIGFADGISSAIYEAQQVHVSNGFTAVHIRSGDVIYSDYRKQAMRFITKAVPIPMAKAVIEKLRRENKTVVVLGEDVQVINALCAEYGVISAHNLPSEKVTTDAERAMFDIVLMSRASEIIGGHSAFSILASTVGLNTRFTNIYSFFPKEEQASIAIEDLSKNAEKYPPLQTAFAYWHAYCWGSWSPDMALDILTQATRHDPENPLYWIARANLLFKEERYSEGNEELKSLAHSEFLRHGQVCLPVFSDLRATTTGGRYVFRDFISHYARAADSGHPYAALFTSLISRPERSGRYLKIALQKIDGDLYLSELQAEVNSRGITSIFSTLTIGSQ